MKTKNFAVFILTHGRPNNVFTINTIRKNGYTGRIILVLDDTDKTREEYKKQNTGVEFYIFNKSNAIDTTDSADNTRNPKAVVYARNIAFDIAKELGIDIFLVLDDDYGSFHHVGEANGSFVRPQITNIEKVFDIFCEFLNKTNIDTIAFAQGGDFIGGSECRYAKSNMLTRKVMNSFFCRTDRLFQFYGLINEDVNMYVLNGSRGKLCFTSTTVQLNQTETQKNKGGLTEIYLEMGTYIKSFYSVMYHPSSVTVSDMGRYDKRIHHKINKDLTYPLILSENIKRKSNG